MASETLPHLGATLYVSAALPATNDSAGFAALTWTKVAGAGQLPQFGITNAMIDIPDIASGFTQAAKGAASGQDSTMQFRDVPGDAGQTLIKATADATGAGGSGSIKIVYGSGANGGTGNAEVVGDEIKYAQGILHSNLDMQGTDSSYRGFEIGFRQNARTVVAAVTA